MIPQDKIKSESLLIEQPFYPDQSEKCWQYVYIAAIILGLSVLLHIAVYATEGKMIFFAMFFITLAYILYVWYFIRKSPKLYIDKAHTYLHIKSPLKDEIIYLKDIQNYDYFNCYGNFSEYPFLSLCIQLILYNGHKVEFFAFMRGAQMIIDNKMVSLGIAKKIK